MIEDGQPYATATDEWPPLPDDPLERELIADRTREIFDELVLAQSALAQVTGYFLRRPKSPRDLLEAMRLFDQRIERARALLDLTGGPVNGARH